MRDLKLYFEEEVGYDINIIDGYPEYVNYTNQTQDQRAGIGASIEKGTIPGMPEIGSDWQSVIDQDNSLLDLSNQIQEMVNLVSGGDGSSGSTYQSLLVPNEDGSVSATVLKGTL